MDRGYKFAITIFIFLFLNTPVLVSSDGAITRNPELNGMNSLSAFEILPTISDPEFESEPSIVTVGDDINYEGSYQEATTDTSSNVELTWHHTKGNQPESSMGLRPDCKDYIYVNESADWPYEELPNGVKCSIEYRFTLDGEFSTAEYGYRFWQLMLGFKNPFGGLDILWDINSLSNADNEGKLLSETKLLSESRIGYTWGDLMEDSWGDPADDYEIILSLCPDGYFIHFGDGSGEYWETYSGSVTVEIFSMNVEIYHDLGVQEGELEEPLARHNYDNESLTEVFDSVLTNENNIYTIGSKTNYAYAGVTKHDRTYSQMLMKWDLEGNLLWDSMWNVSQQTRGYSIALGSDGLYIVGSNMLSRYSQETILSKWDFSGNLLWNTSWGEYTHSMGYGVTVSSSGDVYVLDHALEYYAIDEISSYPTGIRKFDSSGNALWDSPVLIPNGVLFPYVWGYLGNIIDISQDGSLYIIGMRSILKYDSEGVNQWIKLGFEFQPNDIAINSKEEIIMTGANASHLCINILNSDGISLANQTRSFSHGDGWDETIIARSMVISDDDSIQIIVDTDRFDLKRYLLVFNSEGNLIRSLNASIYSNYRFSATLQPIDETRTIVFSTESEIFTVPYSTTYVAYFPYVVASIFGITTQLTEDDTSTFDTPPQPIQEEILQFLSVVTIFSTIGIIAVFVFYRTKQR